MIQILNFKDALNMVLRTISEERNVDVKLAIFYKPFKNRVTQLSEGIYCAEHLAEKLITDNHYTIYQSQNKDVDELYKLLQVKSLEQPNVEYLCYQVMSGNPSSISQTAGNIITNNSNPDSLDNISGLFPIEIAIQSICECIGSNETNKEFAKRLEVLNTLITDTIISCSDGRKPIEIFNKSKLEIESNQTVSSQIEEIIKVLSGKRVDRLAV